MVRHTMTAMLVMAVAACSGNKNDDAKGKTTAPAADKVKETTADPPAKAAPAGAKPSTLLAAPAALPAAAPVAAAAADGLAGKPPGAWVRVGKAGDWRSTRLAAVLGDHLFTIESGDGRLFKTHVPTGKYGAVGKGDYGNSRWLLTSATEVLTIESDGTLFRIDPNTGTWKTVGKAGDWKRTRLAVAHGGYLYTIESGDGRLFKTDIATGKYTALGKGDYGNSRWLLATTDALLTIETDGTLFRINPTDGTWKALGKPGAWKSTRLAAVRDGYLYTIERGDGRLFKTDLASGKYGVIGKGDYGDSRRLLATTRALVTIESDGTLFRVQP